MMRIAALAFLLVVVAAEVAPLLHADNANVIPGAYIVILHEQLGKLDRDAHIIALQDRINETNAKDSEIGFSYNIGSFIGFSARLNKQLLTEQLQHPNVKYIEADQVMSINYEQEARSTDAVVTQSGATWGLRRVSQRSLPLNTYYSYNSLAGKGVDVYVIDTGILATHTDFGGRAKSVFTAIAGEANTDLNGHGTHCAGTIGGTTYGVAKQAQLYGVKVLSASGSGSNSGVIAGINYVTDSKSTSNPTVASMSLGGGASSATDSAVASSIKAGIFYAVAAGNDNADACDYSPARAPTACTVGATTSTDARASYSNFGSCVDVFAPGSSITSDWIGSSNTAVNTISGTSMATPHVAGVAALVLAQESQTPTSLNSWITTWATPNKVTSPGASSPNLLLFSNPQ